MKKLKWNKPLAAANVFFSFIFSPSVSFWVKIRFLTVYLLDSVALSIKKSTVKKIHFLSGRPFYYFGLHQDILLDHTYHHLKTYHRFYHDAETVVDVGASFGTFSLMVNYLNPRAKVLAVEMDQDSFQMLEKNCLSVADKVRVVRAAVGEKDKMVTYQPNSNFPEGSFVVGGTNKEIEDSSKKAERVQQVTLDTLLKKNKINHLSVLKIDTEGYEVNVLRGASKTLAVTDCVIIELDAALDRMNEALSLIEKKGFQLVSIGSTNFNYQKQYIDSIDFVFTKKKRNK